MTIQELIDAIYPPGQPKRPNADQQRVLCHQQGPAWVLAGPGSGKTDVLATLALRLIFVDNDPIQMERVSPESIFITTFTKKAARNLSDRIHAYKERIVAAEPSLKNIDISRLRIGTLHSLCNDVLQEHRSQNYQNVRLLDDFENAMFIYEHLSALRHTHTRAADIPFFRSFPNLIRNYNWPATSKNAPNKWIATFALATLFQRVADDRVSVQALRRAGGHWLRLADLYDEYTMALTNYHRCDFTQVQLRFLEFLRTPLGQQFMTGGHDQARSGIRWVLVDEYQDTNLIQEEVYFTLAQQASHNLVAVGDDDQALYRFRGGSVECMVTFDQACAVYLGNGVSPATYPLVDNYRSHSDIVTFCNDYITSFPVMQQPGARVPGKPPLRARSQITGNYPAVGRLVESSVRAAAVTFAQTVHDLVANGVLTDYSQCCLLLRSTKEGEGNALPYVDALTTLGIPVYNPRNKAFLDQEEVQGLLGTLIAIVDPLSAQQEQLRSIDIRDFAQQCRDMHAALAQKNQQLANYVNASIVNLAENPDKPAPTSLQDLVYLLLSLDPFNSWQGDPVRRVRLAKITSLAESYASMPVAGYQNANRGTLRTPPQGNRGLLSSWVDGFYYSFIGYLAKSGLDDEEDEEVICPPGMFPIMTIHQAKGLQFPFVFVGHMGGNAFPSASHTLEAMFAQFPNNAARVFAHPSAQTRADLDMIRQYFVAYSRPEWALILVGSTSQFNAGNIPCGPNRAWIRNNTTLL
ncbi:MAG: UvrD-helicase domain-containing protein [Vulcanimicrobiaceae bacterium]